MISKPKISLIRSLEHKKFRQQHRLFIAEGRKIILEILKSERFKISELLVLQESINEIPDFQLKKIPVSVISYGTLEKISQLRTPDFGLAVLHMPETETPAIPSEGEMILLLDSIRDPGNFGTIIRLCDWFGVNNIVCSEDTADMYSPKVIQATMGSFCRVVVSYTNHVKWLKSIGENVSIYGTVMNGKSLSTVKPNFPAVVIIGNESIGISEEVLQLVHERITIPGSLQSQAESLNAANAAGIVMYEFFKK